MCYIGSACSRCYASILDTWLWKPALTHSFLWMGGRERRGNSAQGLKQRTLSSSSSFRCPFTASCRPYWSRSARSDLHKVRAYYLPSAYASRDTLVVEPQSRTTLPSRVLQTSTSQRSRTSLQHKRLQLDFRASVTALLMPADRSTSVCWTRAAFCNSKALMSHTCQFRRMVALISRCIARLLC